jgi:hypothetical protein
MKFKSIGLIGIVLGLVVACSPRGSTGADFFYAIRGELKEKVVVRYGQGELADADLSSILAAVNLKNGTNLTESMFRQTEERELFSSIYRRYALTIEGVPVEKSSIRVWLDKQSRQPLQIEVRLQAMPANAAFVESFPNVALTSAAVRRLMNEEFPGEMPRSMSTSSLWSKGHLIQRVEVLGKRGRYQFDFSNGTSEVVGRRFRPFDRADLQGHKPLTAPLYRIWEWANNANTPVQPSELQSREQLPIRNLISTIPSVDPVLVAQSKLSYYLAEDQKIGPLTPDQIAAGFWSYDFLETIYPLRFLREGLFEDNNFSSSTGMRLFGKNAIVMLHPYAPRLLKNQETFVAAPSFIPIPQYNDMSLRVAAALWNRGAHSEEELVSRVALDELGSPRMDDAPWLLKNGFDELQVYYAIDSFMESMRGLGLQDPDLSTRPFTAFLFDPDVENRDNAFCTGDAIFFSTYSANSVNFARDNTTIWHELGHGLMDRLMGKYVDAIEGYGLWEGIADFVSEMMITHEAGRTKFMNRDTMRIINNMWLYNSNENHDDGESYGGVMYDLLQLVMDRYGVEQGLLRTADLVLETMRLTRDLEELTPTEWFEHMKYADSIVRVSVVPGRVPGELQHEIVSALAGRNYAVGVKPARFRIQYKGVELDDRGEGSRGTPVVVSLGKSESFDVVVAVEDGDLRRFSYPITVEVQFRSGPLQGAIRWRDEEKGSQRYTLRSEHDRIALPIALDGACDDINTGASGCKDFVYVKLFNGPDAVGNPIAKKRFYVELNPPVIN